jgi:hypothetical protein
MSRKANTQSAPKGSFRKILAFDEGPNFWKPKKFGETLIGKLLSVTKTKRSPVLQIEKEGGESIQVGVSTQLKRVPWENYIGSTIRLTYQKDAPSSYGTPCKLFDAEVAEVSE